MEQIYSLTSEGLLIPEGSQGFLGTAKAGKKGVLYLALPSNEAPMPYEEEDFLVVAVRKPGRPLLMKCTIHLVRDLEAPVAVLPKGHPSLKRNIVLLAMGPEVEVTARVEGGAEPRVGVLCAPSPELDGNHLIGVRRGVLVRGALSKVKMFIESL